MLELLDLSLLLTYADGFPLYHFCMFLVKICLIFQAGIPSFTGTINSLDGLFFLPAILAIAATPHL